MKALGFVAAGLVFCPVCQEQGLKSRVYPEGTTSTLIAHQPYYDEDGKWVGNDPNTVTQGFRCSRGHRWAKVTQYGKTKIVIERDFPTAGDGLAIEVE